MTLANYDHWLWGENTLREDHPEYLINLEIGVSIRFNSSIAMYADYEEFYNGIADVQFFYGDRPDEDEVDRILTEGWNYLDFSELLRKFIILSFTCLALNILL